MTELIATNAAASVATTSEKAKLHSKYTERHIYAAATITSVMAKLLCEGIERPTC